MLSRSSLRLCSPAKLMEVLEAITGGKDVRCIGIQPRTVPPDGEGGYTAWHRDMNDVHSVAVSKPTDGRVVKAIIYLHDCPTNGGANGCVLGTHKLPFVPREIYGKQFYDGTEATRHRALPLAKIPNSMAFAAPAGWAAIFDITTWHTGLNNDGPHDRQNMIMSYMQAPRFSQPRQAVRDVVDQTVWRRMAKLGRLPASRRRVLGLPEDD